MRTISIRDGVAKLIDELKTEVKQTDVYASKEAMCEFLRDFVRKYYERLHNDTIVTETLTHVVYVFYERSYDEDKSKKFVVKVRFDEDPEFNYTLHTFLPSIDGLLSFFGKSSVFLMSESHRKGYPFIFDFSL